MLTDVDSDNVNDTSAQTTSTVAVVMTPDIGAETDDDHQVNTTSFTVCRVCAPVLLCSTTTTLLSTVVLSVCVPHKQQNLVLLKPKHTS